MEYKKEYANTGGGGIGFVGALTLLFIALKLTGHIAWSWWWVLSPIWITAIVIILLVSVVIYLGVKYGK